LDDSATDKPEMQIRVSLKANDEDDCARINYLKVTGHCCNPHPCTEIPEFPTISLPVAAIIGLAFVFMRREE